MKKHILVLFFALFCNSCLLFAQDSCFTAAPFCTGNTYQYDMSTGIAAPAGPDYGCLGSQASPLWISIYVTSPGNLVITGYGLDTLDDPTDIDFIYWGPFSSMSGVCYSQLDAAHIIGCDYSTDNLINISITGAAAGSYYIAMVSNYSGMPCQASYSQTGGSGVATCSLPCSFTSLTAVPSACNFSDNAYSVSGTMNFSNPPATGTLTVFGSCGGSQTFFPPFTSPLNYAFSGLSSDSSVCFVSAIFSSSTGCSLNQAYQAPAKCNPDLSVKENISQMKVIISPNPSNGLFDLSFESSSQEISVFITDILGRTIYKEELKKFAGFYKKQIDLSSYKGIYFVNVLGEKGNATKKIICN